MIYKTPDVMQSITKKSRKMNDSFNKSMKRQKTIGSPLSIRRHRRDSHENGRKSLAQRGSLQLMENLQIANALNSEEHARKAELKGKKEEEMSIDSESSI
jgi:hypothetical protein